MATDELLGTLLGGEYRIRSLLGRGGMGTVYEADQQSLGRKVAIKVLSRELSARHEAVERFRREAISAARLGHPNIIQVQSFCADEGGLAYLVMELLQGETLAQRMERVGILGDDELSTIGHQVLDALAAAHAAGIVHRDIKPENLFLTRVGSGVVVKVLDFGVAKLDSDQRITREGMLVGSPLYMAPEQAYGSSVDARADLYSLGATMYHARTGVPPFDGDSLPRILVLLKEAPLVPMSLRVPDVGPDFAAWVERALAKRPDERFQTAVEMREALLSLPSRSGHAVSSPRATPRSDAPSAFAATVLDGPAPSPANVAPPRTAHGTLVSPAEAPGARRVPSTPPLAASGHAHASPSPTPRPQNSSFPVTLLQGQAPPSKSKVPLAVLLVSVSVLGGAGAWMGLQRSDHQPPTPVASTTPLPLRPSARPSAQAPVVVPASAARDAQAPPASPIVLSGGAASAAQMYCRLNDAASLYDDTTDLDTAIQSLTDVRTCADVACPFVAKDGVYYTLEVTVSGNVRSAVPGGNACEPLDRCIRDATRKTQLPRPKSPGTVRVYCTIHA